MFTLTEQQEAIGDTDPKDFTEFNPQNIEAKRDECEELCMKIETCTFYQYHYITEPPLLAANNCLYVKNETAAIIGSAEVPQPKIKGTND